MKPLASHCLRGHLRTPENLKANGSCKACDKELSAARRTQRTLANPKPAKTHCRKGHPVSPENRTPAGACRPCMRERERRYKKSHPEKRRAIKKRYREKHPEKHKDYHKTYNKVYHKTHPQKPRTPEQNAAKFSR